jgi:hypothetical protein
VVVGERDSESLLAGSAHFVAETFTGELMEHKCALKGKAIVVLDRGFVYVGDAVVENEWLTMTNAKNIRVWGTTKGLGELVNGPLKDTRLDVVGSLRAPLRAVIHIIDADAAKWNA